MKFLWNYGALKRLPDIKACFPLLSKTVMPVKTGIHAESRHCREIPVKAPETPEVLRIVSACCTAAWTPAFAGVTTRKDGIVCSWHFPWTPLGLRRHDADSLDSCARGLRCPLAPIGVQGKIERT
ncbi:MAG TPA: hypothetical protein ENK15_01945 [Thermopetrobacter sp.]|nr:hypothetical protein [Thermopetrobacter sp.]